jgi:pimeloyl-ACP methyl ester carboxylesterase
LRRGVALILIIGLVALSTGVLGTLLVLRDPNGSSSSAPRGVPLPRSDDARTPPTPALARFYEQSLDWTPCDGVDCATLTVPLDYARPAQETIEIAVLRRAADVPGERLGSLVVNPGGPGAPGQSYAAGGTGFFRPQLTDRFDLVGFDPRGTGASSPVDCLSDDQLDDYVAEEPDPDTPEEVAAFVRSARSFGRGCTKRSGAVAAHVSTEEAARDIDVLRAALGESQLAYFGASYGTQLGATYADLFPERVGRLVLDGAIDPTLDAEELQLQQAASFQTALDAYIQNCLESTDACFLGDSLEEGRQRIADFLAAVETDPLPAGDRQLRAGNAFYGLITPLYARDYWFLLSTALRAGFAGDGAPLLALSDAYTSRALDGSGYTDNTLEAYVAITCADDPESLPATAIERLLPSFEEASPTLGRAFAWSLVGCRGFPRRPPPPPPPDVLAAGAAPIVVVGTSRDPATPLAWAEALADQLDSGVLIRRDGDGHTGYNAGNLCVDEAVEAYLIAGDVPPDGLSC